MNPSGCRRQGALIDATIFIAGILPYLLIEHLPLVDWPNHLARQHIIFNLADVDILKSYYAFDWHFVPNLGFDLFVQLFAPLLGVELSARLFLITTCFLIFIGVRAISLATWHGESRWYRVAPLLFYSGPFQYGFLSYLFGLGVCLVAFAWFLKQIERRSIAGWLGLTCLTALMMTIHLSAFAVYTTAIGAFLLFNLTRQTIADRHRFWPSLRDSVVAGLHVLPAAALFFIPPPSAVVSHSAQENSVTFIWSVQRKLEALISPVYFSDRYGELAILLLLMLAAGALIFLRLVKIRPEILVPSIVILALTIIVPSVGLGGGYIDYRLPTAAWLFGLGAIGPSPDTSARHAPVHQALAGAIGLLVTVRIIVIGASWWQWQPVYRQFEEAFSRLPVGARVFVVVGYPPSVARSLRPPLTHEPSLLAARRHALVPQLFSDMPSHHLLRVLPNNGKPKMVEAVTEFDTREATGCDYLFAVDPQFMTLTGPAPDATVYSGERFTIYRLSSATAG